MRFILYEDISAQLFWRFIDFNKLLKLVDNGIDTDMAVFLYMYQLVTYGTKNLNG